MPPQELVAAEEAPGVGVTVTVGVGAGVLVGTAPATTEYEPVFWGVAKMSWASAFLVMMLSLAAKEITTGELVTVLPVKVIRAKRLGEEIFRPAVSRVKQAMSMIVVLFAPGVIVFMGQLVSEKPEAESIRMLEALSAVEA